MRYIAGQKPKSIGPTPFTGGRTMQTAGSQAAQALQTSHAASTPNGLLFDKSTHHLVKIRDSFENTYIFSLPNTEIPNYKNAMSKGDLVAFRLSGNKEFRKPFTDEKLESHRDFHFLTAIPVGEPAKAFVKRIGKILDPEAKEIALRGGIRGADKLKGLNLGGQAAPPVPGAEGAILFRGKPLTKIGEFYYAYDNQICVKCGKTIITRSQIQVKDGQGVAQTTKKAVVEIEGVMQLDKHTHRVVKPDGTVSRVDWAHDACLEDKGAQQPAGDLAGKEAAPAGVADVEADKGTGKAPTALEQLSAKALAVLTREDKTSDWKVGYLAHMFETN